MNDVVLATIIILIYFSPVLYQVGKLLIEIKKGNKLSLKKLYSVLKITTILFVIVLSFFLSLSHTNFLNYEGRLEYNKIDQITFKNFRGLNLFKETFYGKKEFAYIVTKIDYEFDGDNVSIQSYFYPSRSFVYNRKTLNPQLLTHELYHFKITELYARKAKRRMVENKVNTQSEIRKIINQIRLEERLFQKEYDFETFHSYVYSEQKKYENNIDSLLNLHLDYKNPKLKFIN